MLADFLPSHERSCHCKTDAVRATDSIAYTGLGNISRAIQQAEVGTLPLSRFWILCIVYGFYRFWNLIRIVSEGA